MDRAAGGRALDVPVVWRRSGILLLAIISTATELVSTEDLCAGSTGLVVDRRKGWEELEGLEGLEVVREKGRGDGKF